MRRFQERLEDDAAMGVEHIWIFDPYTRRAWKATADGSHTLRAARVCRSRYADPPRLLADVSAELDDMQTPR